MRCNGTYTRGKMRNIYIILVRITEGKKKLIRRWLRRNNNIQTDINTGNKHWGRQQPCILYSLLRTCAELCYNLLNLCSVSAQRAVLIATIAVSFQHPFCVNFAFGSCTTPQCLLRHFFSPKWLTCFFVVSITVGSHYMQDD
jgi:hypothetical protein